MTLVQNGYPYLSSPAPPPKPALVKSLLHPHPHARQRFAAPPGVRGALRVLAPTRMPASFFGHRLVVAVTCARISSWGSVPPDLKAPWREPSSSQLAEALSAGTAWGSSLVRGTGSVRSAHRDSGHNAPLPLEAGARAPQTPARPRLDRSILPRPGLRQLLPAWDRPWPPASEQRPRGRVRGVGTWRSRSCLTAHPYAECPGAWT